MWNARSPGGMPLSESLIKTPAGVCARSTMPTSLPLLSLSVALADCAAAGKAMPAASKAAVPTVATYFKIAMIELLVELLGMRIAGDRLGNRPRHVRFRDDRGRRDP